ncbi:hypothetical protein RCL1_004836 [Eukaryota sp. TZLM3-RCL]
MNQKEETLNNYTEKIKEITENRSNFDVKIKNLIKSNSWLKDVDLSNPNCEFNFNEINIHEIKSKFSEANNFISLKKKQGFSETDFDKHERIDREFNDLTKKRTQLEADATRISDVITQLDEKKTSLVNKSWRQVNTDLGVLFSTLLPGATARLVPYFDDNEALVGLTFNVGFGGVWKESLGELSGGQKSLLALSMVLSLLKFNPAPLYILDEIDSALDLSHTQNIGKLISWHFSQSQFLIVSLKEGMFNNANVIFTTRFVDGTSQVTRTRGVQISDYNFCCIFVFLCKKGRISLQSFCLFYLINVL